MKTKSTGRPSKESKKLMFKYIALMAFAIAVASGCSKSTSSKDTQNNTTTSIPTITDPTVPVGGSDGVTYPNGSTSTIKPVSLAMMNQYVYTRPLNNPTNYKININLSTPGAGVYGGDVSISYTDNGITYEGVFKSGLGKNASYTGMYDNGKWESEFNYWFTFNNKTNFSGFFEDEFGAIAVVLEPQGAVTGGNDAEPVPTQKYKGSIYFRNFLDKDGKPVFGPHSPYRACWFTYTGAYDCRSNVVMTKCGLNPGVDAGYRLLGTFENVDVKTGFNIN